MPAKSVANQLPMVAKKTTMPHSDSQIRCGITRMSRKNTVRRLRLRSSERTSRMGCRTARMLAVTRARHKRIRRGDESPGGGAEPPAPLPRGRTYPRRRAIGFCPGRGGSKHPRGRNRLRADSIPDAASMPARRARAPPSEGPPIPRARRLALATALALAAGLAASATASAALPYVAVDPGHGGGDTGAVGELPPGAVTGLPPRADAQGRPVLMEKDVNLDIGLRLDGYLRGRGARTILTRTTDLAGGDRPYTTETADLRARVDIANEAGAELFVSVHNNALSRTASGTETYHFYYASPSARLLAQDVQTEVVAALGLPDRGVKSAGFYVLRHSVMPAVLVEGAFLSNPSEALLLADPNVRQRIAEAVGRGVERFAARAVAAPPRLAPTIGPWRVRPARVPAGYRLVRTGRGNPVGRGGWLAVIAGFRPPPSALPATIGPWRTRPASAPPGYRLVHTGPANATGHGGWLAVSTAPPAAAAEHPRR